MNDLIADVVLEIISRADETKRLYAGNDVEYGRLLGYAETLSIIKQEYMQNETIFKLLDFDIDKRYL